MVSRPRSTRDAVSVHERCLRATRSPQIHHTLCGGTAGLCHTGDGDGQEPGKEGALMSSVERAASERPAVVDRVNVALIAEAVEALGRLQERTGLKKVDLVNRALLIYEFVDAEMRAGNKVLLRDPEGRDQLVKIFL